MPWNELSKRPRGILLYSPKDADSLILRYAYMSKDASQHLQRKGIGQGGMARG